MFFKRDLVLAQEYLAFLLLNLFDLFLTGYIFKHHGVEANAIALWVLKEFGLTGFALYKFLMVVFLIVVCEAIAFASVRKARIIIVAACAVYLLVVLYESYMIVTGIDLPQPPDNSVRPKVHRQTTLAPKTVPFALANRILADDA